MCDDNLSHSSTALHILFVANDLVNDDNCHCQRQLVARCSGRLLVFPCPVLDLQLTGDHLCGQTVRYWSANQADSAFYPFGSINE